MTHIQSKRGDVSEDVLLYMTEFECMCVVQSEVEEWCKQAADDAIAGTDEDMNEEKTSFKCVCKCCRKASHVWVGVHICAFMFSWLSLWMLLLCHYRPKYAWLHILSILAVHAFPIKVWHLKWSHWGAKVRSLSHCASQFSYIWISPLQTNQNLITKE